MPGNDVKVGDRITENEKQPLWAITKYLHMGITYDGKSGKFHLEEDSPAHPTIHFGILRAWPGNGGSGLYFNYIDPKTGKTDTAWIALTGGQNNLLNGLINHGANPRARKEAEAIISNLLKENPDVAKLLRAAQPIQGQHISQAFQEGPFQHFDRRIQA
jgi:hypothetical protein